MKKTMISLVTLSVSTCTVAELVPSSNYDGIRLGVGRSMMYIDGSEIKPEGSLFLVGYDFNRFLGASFVTSIMSSSDSASIALTTGRYSSIVESDVKTFSLSLDAGYTFGDWRDITFKPYGIGGLTVLKIDEQFTSQYCFDSSCIGARRNADARRVFTQIGVGSRVTFFDGIGITAECVRSFYLIDNSLHFDQFSISASYKF